MELRLTKTELSVSFECYKKINWFYYGEDIQTLDSSPTVFLGRICMSLKGLAFYTIYSCPPLITENHQWIIADEIIGVF